MEATATPTYYFVEIPKSRWFSAIQHRCLSRDEYGTPLVQVNIRRWHPGAWLHMWRMRRADWITMPMAEA